MILGGGLQDRPSGIAGLKGGRQAPHAPGAAEIDAVQVGDLAVGGIGDQRGAEQRRRLAVRQAGQEPPEPAAELSLRQHPAHQLRFHQRRGQEVVARRLPGLAVRVVREPGLCARRDQPGEVVVTAGLRIVAGQRQGEGRVRVGSGADRIGQLGQIGLQPRREDLGQGSQRFGPDLRLSPTRQFRLQLQEPRRPIGPLEARARRPVQIGQLAPDLARRELPGQQGADVVRRGALGIKVQHPRRQPMSVYARMPVEAAIEDRVQGARALGVVGAGQHVVELVGVFALHVAQGDAGETSGDLGGQAMGHGELRRGRPAGTSGRC